MTSARSRALAATFALSLAVATSAPARAEFDPADDRPVRITSETGFGILGGVGGAFAGGLIGFGVCAAVGEDEGMFSCLLGFFVGALAGELAGIGLGVYGGGELAGGNGGLGWTFLGEGSAALLSGIIIGVAEVEIGDLSWWLLTTVVPLAGAVIGYELSNTREGPHTVGGSFTFLF